ncbi:MAG: glycosyltransferase [Pseudomonadota bacterium]
MRIAVLSHVRHPVAQPFMGGMEAHSWHLVRALRARGHDVTLFASGDSDHDPVPILDTHYDRDFPWHDHHGTEALNRHVDAGFARTMRHLLDGGFDVVHNNSLHRYPPRLARQHGLPMVTSLHVPPFDALHRAVQESPAPWSRFTVTSAVQVESWWADAPPPEAHVVHNGIDADAFPFVAEGDGTAVWAGRITPTKGTHLAVTAAQFANMPLTIYGTVERQDYFDRMIAPYLGDRIRYGGHLTGDDLAARIGRATVFLFTPLWDEPFGLAAVEAMSCGVPVAAIENGAVREVVGEEAGRFAPPNDPAALGLAARKAMGIDRRIPRARVKAMFTIDRMVDAYEALYAEARAGLGRTAPPVDFPLIELAVEDGRPIAAE